jgi:hypothetical protein
MKKWFVLPILCLLLVVCIKPERDNEYDPNNPNKAYLEGNVYGFDETPVEDAWIILFNADSTDTIEEYSNAHGWYGFEDVDPGIYTLVAQSGYYGCFEWYPESLPAGAEDTIDIWFNTAMWDFENEQLGTQEPKGFHIIDTLGTWKVIDDPEQEHVYQGVTPGTGLALAATDIGANDFFYESMFKVDPISGAGFFVGLTFRFQDDQNYYLVVCSSTGMSFIEVQGGGWAPLDTVARAFALDRWYSLAVECCGDRIQVFVDNGSAPVFDITNNTFHGGHVGLFAEHNTTVSFDNIYLEKWE